ncbi:MAG: 3-hydroxyacyl-CoA dehydrogenase family protein [Lachnospiraceae bacterium]|nr:3-hydroxyacyl-CoA dehydrogenase family protein [Lachnospiraceae bacterium]
MNKTSVSKKIAVLGAGTMGAGIAAVYAAGGYDVSLYSRTEKTLDKARQTIGAIIAFFREEKLYPSLALENAEQRICYTTWIEEAVDRAFYIVETVIEKPEIKQEVYQTLDAVLPSDVIVSSNTSYMNIFEFMPEERQEKLVIVHWVAPPHILPLVEVVKGPRTSEETLKAMMELHEGCGKTPVRMEKYIPGFILNRLQSAMNREVIGLIQEGYCTPEMMDKAVKTSLMPRGLLLGVVQRMDFNGIDQVAHGLHNKSFVPFDAPPEHNIITDMADHGEKGVKSGIGFRDYTELGNTLAVQERDKLLIQSVRLSQFFMEHPIGKERNWEI